MKPRSTWLYMKQEPWNLGRPGFYIWFNLTNLKSDQVYRKISRKQYYYCCFPFQLRFRSYLENYKLNISNLAMKLSLHDFSGILLEKWQIWFSFFL